MMHKTNPVESASFLQSSDDYQLFVGDTPVPVYATRVRAEILTKPGLWSHKPDAPAQRASFAILHVSTPTTIAIKPNRPFASAAILPRRAGINPQLSEGMIRFRLQEPAHHLTLALDNKDDNPLHLLISSPNDAGGYQGKEDILRFGPGVHHTQGIILKSDQTLLLEDGAIIRAVLPPADKGVFSDKWQVTFHSGAAVEIKNAENVRVVGHGVITASDIPHPGWNMIRISNSKNVVISGITLLDAANWNVVIANSENITIDDVRIISARLNTDGINSVNSRRVTIRNCFVRNHDDGIVIKTTQPSPPASDITVQDCTLWADWGYAMGVTYETRADVKNVLFERCNVLFARHWNFGIHVSDSATVSNVTFRDIEVDDLGSCGRTNDARDALALEPLLARFVITSDVWGHDPERGRIENITLDNIRLNGSRILRSELLGYDDLHKVSGVFFRNVRTADGRVIRSPADLSLGVNNFVERITFE